MADNEGKENPDLVRERILNALADASAAGELGPDGIITSFLMVANVMLEDGTTVKIFASDNNPVTNFGLHAIGGIALQSSIFSSGETPG